MQVQVPVQRIECKRNDPSVSNRHVKDGAMANDHLLVSHHAESTYGESFAGFAATTGAAFGAGSPMISPLYSLSSFNGSCSVLEQHHAAIDFLCL